MVYPVTWSATDGVDTKISHESGMTTDPFQSTIFHESTRHVSLKKLKTCLTHCFFKMKSACHKCVKFSVTRCTCTIFGFLFSSQKMTVLNEKKIFWHTKIKNVLTDEVS